jgi:hypothetical protein
VEKEIFKDWKPEDLAIIQEFEFNVDHRTPHSNTLKISFLGQRKGMVNEWPDREQKFFHVKISFENVSGLEIKFVGSGIHQIMGFEIIDISKNGWENINYQIADYEDGRVKFYCKKIMIEAFSDLIDFQF